MLELKDSNQEVIFSPRGGGLAVWKYHGVDVFFPEQEIEVNGTKKLRGGMPICFPNFGDAPATFGLPRHGLLRTLHITEWTATGPVIESEELFGSTKIFCEVSTLVELQEHGFDFIFTVKVPKPLSELPFVNPAFHPYFRTPSGEATLLGSPPVTEPMHGAEYREVSKTIDLTIPELGKVTMRTSGDWKPRSVAEVVLWRDSTQYLCVEPFFLKPEEYGSPECARLTDGFTMKCRFEVSLE